MTGPRTECRLSSSLGVSRASFYFHFPTKDHVLLELQWNLELRIVERLQGHESLRSALHEFIDGLIEAEGSVGDPELNRDMFRIYTRRPEGLSLEAHPFPVMYEIGRRFAVGARKGELRLGLDPAQATHLFLTSVFGYLIGSNGPPEAWRTDLEVLISLYLREEGGDLREEGGDLREEGGDPAGRGTRQSGALPARRR